MLVRRISIRLYKLLVVTLVLSIVSSSIGFAKNEKITRWTASAAALTTVAIPPDGPEQMPVLFVHGFIDDGTAWAREELSLDKLFERVSAKYNHYYVIGPQRSPAAFFAQNGMENWAVQWWSTDDGNPYSNADQGYAFLMSSEELLKGTDWVRGTWTAQNRPLPSARDVLLAPLVDVATNHLPIPIPDYLPTPELNVAVASQLLIENNYNDAGRVDPRAQDLLDLLRYERGPGGRLARYRQVNLITHSMGSLVTRALLDKTIHGPRWLSQPECACLVMDGIRELKPPTITCTPSAGAVRAQRRLQPVKYRLKAAVQCTTRLCLVLLTEGWRYNRSTVRLCLALPTKGRRYGCSAGFRL